MEGARDIFAWGTGLFMGEMVTFISNCGGYAYTGSERGVSVIPSGSLECSLYLKLGHNISTSEDFCGFHIDFAMSAT